MTEKILYLPAHNQPYKILRNLDWILSCTIDLLCLIINQCFHRKDLFSCSKKGFWKRTRKGGKQKLIYLQEKGNRGRSIDAAISGIQSQLRLERPALPPMLKYNLNKKYASLDLWFLASSRPNHSKFATSWVSYDMMWFLSQPMNLSIQWKMGVLSIGSSSITSRHSSPWLLVPIGRKHAFHH